MFARSLNRLAVMSALGVALAGCGGEGEDPPTGGPAPVITEFSADQPAYFIGDKATLTVRFSGGTGRIDPDIGAVQSDATVQTGALDGTRELRLVVESSTGKVSRSLRLPVQYRDRYRALGTDFTSRGHTASLAGDGSVLLIGGSRGQGTLSTSIDRFDPRSNTLLKVGDLRNGREGHRAVRLNSGRILYQYHSTTMSRRAAALDAFAPEGYILLHPSDADRVGVRDGDRVRVVSRRGRLETRVRIADEVREGESFMPFHYGGHFQGKDLRSKYPEGADPYVLGEACNTAMTYGYDSVTQMQETKCSLCRISRA